MPSLNLRVGVSKVLRPVASLEEASATWKGIRDASTVTEAQSPTVTVIDEATGETVAKISFSGRVWSMDGRVLIK